MPQGNGIDWRVALSALSTAVPLYDQYRTANKQFDEIMAGRNRQRRAEEEAEAAAKQNLADVARADSSADRSNRLREYSTAVRQSRARATGQDPNIGGERFQTDTKAAGQKTAQRTATQAGNLATVDAASDQRRRTAIGTNRANDAITRAQSRMRANDFITRLRASQIVANPWIRLLGGVGQQIADTYQTDEESLGSLLEPIDMSTLPQRRPTIPIAGPPRR